MCVCMCVCVCVREREREMKNKLSIKSTKRVTVHVCTSIANSLRTYIILQLVQKLVLKSLQTSYSGNLHEISNVHIKEYIG